MVFGIWYANEGFTVISLPVWGIPGFLGFEGMGVRRYKEMS